MLIAAARVGTGASLVDIAFSSVQFNVMGRQYKTERTIQSLLMSYGRECVCLYCSEKQAILYNKEQVQKHTQTKSGLKRKAHSRNNVHHTVHNTHDVFSKLINMWSEGEVKIHYTLLVSPTSGPRARLRPSYVPACSRFQGARHPQMMRSMVNQLNFDFKTGYTFAGMSSRLEQLE